MCHYGVVCERHRRDKTMLVAPCSAKPSAGPCPFLSIHLFQIDITARCKDCIKEWAEENSAGHLNTIQGGQPVRYSGNGDKSRPLLPYAEDMILPREIKIEDHMKEYESRYRHAPYQTQCRDMVLSMFGHSAYPEIIERTDSSKNQTHNTSEISRSTTAHPHAAGFSYNGQSTAILRPRQIYFHNQGDMAPSEHGTFTPAEVPRYHTTYSNALGIAYDGQTSAPLPSSYVTFADHSDMRAQLSNHQDQIAPPKYTTNDSPFSFSADTPSSPVSNVINKGSWNEYFPGPAMAHPCDILRELTYEVGLEAMNAINACIGDNGRIIRHSDETVDLTDSSADLDSAFFEYDYSIQGLRGARQNHEGCDGDFEFEPDMPNPTEILQDMSKDPTIHKTC